MRDQETRSKFKIPFFFFCFLFMNLQTNMSVTPSSTLFRLGERKKTKIKD